MEINVKINELGSMSDSAKSISFEEIAKEYFPSADADEIDHIIYGHTGFPAFWNIPEDGSTPEECFRKQLQEYKDGKNIESSLCCGNPKIG